MLGQEKQHTLKANLSYNSIHKTEPDNRDYTFFRFRNKDGKELTDEENPWQAQNEIVSFYLLSRVFNDIREHTMQGNIDLDYRFNTIWGFKTGFYHETSREGFQQPYFRIAEWSEPARSQPGDRRIEICEADNGNTPGIMQVKEKYLQQYFATNMFREDGTGYRWVEKNNPQ